MRRAASGAPDEGAYAVLYATLVVVLIGMAAIVVDFAAVRQDRRLDRSASDAAALGGVALLDITAKGGANPQAGCNQAWAYLATTLRITTPVGACSAFAGINAATYCAAATPVQIADTRTVGTRTFQIAWPVASGADGGYLTPDLAPGGVSQPGNAVATPGPGNTDGYSNGCDKLGVAITENQKLELGSVFGYTSADTQVHSVARVIPQEGSPDYVAALNVLNPTECPAIRTSGGGKVVVGPSRKPDGTVTGPGIIAVESDANDKTCNTGNATDPNTSTGTFICANGAAGSTCDGGGRILSHALDPGGNAAHAYSTAALFANLNPRPVSERGTHSYLPVTQKYGCVSLSSCDAPSPNFIGQLAAVYGGSGVPTSVYSSGQAPYSAPLYPVGSYPWVTRNDLCPGGSGVNTVVVVPVGNTYVPCDLDIAASGAVIFQGGNVVIDGNLTNAGCLVVNTLVATCPASFSPTATGAHVTTVVQPTGDALLFARGKAGGNKPGIQISGRVVMPQTMVFLGGSHPFEYSGTGLSLWTAPGAGDLDGSGRTNLESRCYVAATKTVDETCMDSHFARVTLWSEYAATQQDPNRFTGQASLGIVGVFFTPRGYFNLTGGQSLPAVATQFWADKIDITGSGTLPLSPYDNFAFKTFGPDLVLIR